MTLYASARSIIPYSIVIIPFLTFAFDNRGAACLIEGDQVDGGFAGDTLELSNESLGPLQRAFAARFSWCPKGVYQMGSPVSELDRQQFENQVSVELTNGFWMSQTEVTQEQWTTVMGSRPWHGIHGVSNVSNLPATNVSYFDALRFCESLTQFLRSTKVISNSWQISLPTEAQWEYACRSGSTTAYYFGESPNQLSDYAWCYYNKLPDNSQYSSRPVGKLKPNSWGIYDMLGNVDEWCLDLWTFEDYAGGKDPRVKLLQKFDRDLFVIRGGNFEDGERDCRCASRHFYSPEQGSEFTGFRIVLQRTLE